MIIMHAECRVGYKKGQVRNEYVYVWNRTIRLVNEEQRKQRGTHHK